MLSLSRSRSLALALALSLSLARSVSYSGVGYVAQILCRTNSQKYSTWRLYTDFLEYRIGLGNSFLFYGAARLAVLVL